ncbi:nitroreductase family deazaflavin-dependent oxidoreductase [Planosporangium thailandense]|uniref:Nitroreductase family deazaflavin-dependent oxidoreductase n=1 Tax=Planosporangium thailandense TaxID=765197 RepID=A0ABX0Y0Q3_9ACTN|nr:nitroreductase family deazaflavin-dependent oxidoreductase [Planosporangium thailandense]NJC71908.1 nitroreductase family deazaflavin-dependent oxidoreductase [Planosporangium thailandense]
MTEPRRTDPTTMTREEMRAFNTAMVDRIRAAEPQPYAEECYVLRVVHVCGRHSGQLRTFPIAVTQLDCRRYLCAPHRGRDWVRNLLAAGNCRVERDPVPDHRAVLVDGDEAAPVVAAYLRKLDRPTNQWPFRPDAPVSEIRQHTDQLAIFRLEPEAD